MGKDSLANHYFGQKFLVRPVVFLSDDEIIFLFAIKNNDYSSL